MDLVSNFLYLSTQIPFLVELLLFFVTSVPFVIVQQKRNPAYHLSQGLVRLLAVCIFLVGGIKTGLSGVFGHGLPIWMGTDKLESLMIGGRRWTSVEAISRFVTSSTSEATSKGMAQS